MLIARVDVPPGVNESGEVVIDTVGAGLGVTTTVTVVDVLPPEPVAATVYVVVVAGLTAVIPPLAGKV